MMSVNDTLKQRFGPWAVVTGASEGIGRAIAVQLATAGLNLVLVARRRAALEELAVALQLQRQISCEVLDIDLADAHGVATLLAATVGRDIGLLVAAAGFGTSGPFLDNGIETELEMIDVNCRAVAELAHGYGARFVSRGRGGLILMSSLLAFQGVPRAANYAATKAYIQVLAEGLSQELSAHHVDVLAVAPGPIRSGFASRANMSMSMSEGPEVVARGAVRALGRWGTIRPGRLSKLLEYSLSPLPRALRTLIMSKVMAGMTRRLA
jgi:short-subunit dehydrogenase